MLGIAPRRWSLSYLFSLVFKLLYCFYILLIWILAAFKPTCTYWTLQHVISTHLTSTAPLQILRIRPEIQSNPSYISVFCSFGSHLTSVEFLLFVFPGVHSLIFFVFSLAYVRAQAAMCRLVFYYVLTCWRGDSTNSAAKQIIFKSLAVLSRTNQENNCLTLWQL